MMKEIELTTGDSILSPENLKWIKKDHYKVSKGLNKNLKRFCKKLTKNVRSAKV